MASGAQYIQPLGGYKWRHPCLDGTGPRTMSDPGACQPNRFRWPELHANNTRMSNTESSTAPTGLGATGSSDQRRLPTPVTSGPIGRTLLVLALPVLGEQALNTMVGLFDTWLAGRISAVATSAVGLGAYVGWLASMIVMLVGTGTTALIARHAGSGDDEEVHRDANQSVVLSIVLGAVLLVVLYSLAPQIGRAMGMTGEAFDITVKYLRIDAYGHIFMSVTLVGCAALRGVGDMRTPMVLFAIINGVNIFASTIMVLVFDMGVVGIATGTVAARTVGGLLMILILVRGRSGLILRRSELRIDWSRVKRILRIGAPAAVDGAILWSGHFALLAIVTRVAEGAAGQAALAAHIIAVRVEALTYLPAVAWGTATATMIGQSLGAGIPDRAKRAGYAAALQCGALSVVMAAFFYFGAGFIYEQMSADPLVRGVGVPPFRMLALLQPLMAVSIVFIWGMRGAGDTRYPMMITIVGVFIRVSAGYYFGIVRGGGLMGAWFGMFGDMTWRALASTVRYVGGRWQSTKI